MVRNNYDSEQIRIAFNPMEERFEVHDAAIQRDKSFIPDISRIWSGGTNIFKVVKEYLEELQTAREVNEDEIEGVQNAITKLQALLTFPFTALELAARARTKRQGAIHNNRPPLSLYQTEIPSSDRINQVQKSTKRNQSEQPTTQSRIQPLSLFLFAILKLPGPASYIPVAGRSKGDFPADPAPPSPSAPGPWTWTGETRRV